MPIRSLQDHTRIKAPAFRMSQRERARMRFDTPHRRWNPLRKEWVLNSPHRMSRPWQGKIEVLREPQRESYDSKCYLCPGNARTGGVLNPVYTDVFAFSNDFPALLPDSSPFLEMSAVNGVIKAQGEHGLCRVLCFSPRHDLTMADMDVPAIDRVIQLWRDEYLTLREHPSVLHVMTFENKGELMGTSNPHPHGQIWATSYIPTIPQKEIDSQKEYWASHSTPLLSDYLAWELEQGKRIVISNDEWVALVPFWAQWPYEILVLPRMPIRSVCDLTDSQRISWASLLQELLIRLDNIFHVSFPYSMGLFQEPTKGAESPGFVLHQVFLPPLLRSATVKKFMVGFELCAEPQRDLTPEVAAGILRDSSPRRNSRARETTDSRHSSKPA